MGGRVVEGTGLENRKTRKRFEGSNPSPSPIQTKFSDPGAEMPERRPKVPHRSSRRAGYIANSVLSCRQATGRRIEGRETPGARFRERPLFYQRPLPVIGDELRRSIPVDAAARLLVQRGSDLSAQIRRDSSQDRREPPCLTLRLSSV
jgi:hypothetical protein